MGEIRKDLVPTFGVPEEKQTITSDIKDDGSSLSIALSDGFMGENATAYTTWRSDISGIDNTSLGVTIGDNVSAYMNAESEIINNNIGELSTNIDVHVSNKTIDASIEVNQGLSTIEEANFGIYGSARYASSHQEGTLTSISSGFKVTDYVFSEKFGPLENVRVNEKLGYSYQDIDGHGKHGIDVSVSVIADFGFNIK